LVSWKGAVALAVVLVGLLAYLYLNRGGAAPAPAATDLLPCPPDQAVELKLTGSDGKVVDALRDSPAGAWRLLSPAGKPADPVAIDSLVGTAAGIQASATPKEPPPASQAGLDPPALVATCTLAGGRSVTLSVGGQNFDGSGYYARSSAGDKLYVIPAAPVATLRNALDSPPVAASPSPSGGPSPSPSA